MDPVAANAAGHTRKERDIRKMRTRYTLINMVVNVGGQLMNQVLLFISRMVFIHYLSAAYLGVNGLFTDVLGILNLAELGVGTAMIYSLYEPAAKNDEHRLAQLMNLYRLLYRIVAVVVLLVGLALMPFLGFFIKDSSGIEHLRLIYLMYVANSVCSYLLSYKNSIYLAYQKAYVRNLWAQLCDAVKTLFQIVLIVLTGNFILYLAVQFVMQFIPNIIVSVKVDKEFPYLKECRELPEKEKFHGILRNVGAMSFHKLGTVIVRNTDSLLMSSFVGLLSVGIYSNYKLVLSGINNLMDKFSNAFTGSLGNLGAIEDETRVYSIYRELDLLFFVIYAYWTAGLFALFNAFITLCFSAEYCFSTATVAVLVTEFYVSGQRKVNLLFREAKGLFWYDRYKPLFESAINLAASLLLVQKFGVGRHSGRNGHQHRDDLPLDGALHPDALRHPGRLAGQAERLLCPLRRTRCCRRGAGRCVLRMGKLLPGEEHRLVSAGRCAVYTAVRGCHGGAPPKRAGVQSAQGPCDGCCEEEKRIRWMQKSP